MADNEAPKEAEKTIYQRDKTAKEPQRPEDAPKTPPRPKIKPKKMFVPKKAVLKTDKPMERKVRHIRLSSMDAATIIRATLVDFQKELAEQPVDDPDKEFHDREKVEKLFVRLAKKYSNCRTKGLGGDLGWVYAGRNIDDQVMPQEMQDIVMKAEQYTVPETIKTKLGLHLIYIAESQIHTPKEKPEAPNQPKVSNITPN